MLTNRCNFKCNYCFGMDWMENNHVPDMTKETFMDIINWYEIKPHRDRTIHLMGGEPTLHKDFIWMTNYLLDKKINVWIFTNLATKFSPKIAEVYIDIPLKWVVNVNPPEFRTDKENDYLYKSLEILGKNVTLTLNILPSLTSIDWIIDLIFKFNLSKKIKIGFALPTLSFKNEHLADNEYAVVANKVEEYAKYCKNFNISFDYECGIPWCSFTEAQLGELWSYGSKLFSTCNSILDITTDGKVIYCLPLSKMLAVHFSDFTDYPSAKDWFEQKFSMYRPMGTTDNCFDCILMKCGACRGGCLARILKGINNLNINTKDYAEQNIL